MNILNEIPELLEAGVITEETAGRIRAHYEQKRSAAPNRLFIVFGILGAILTGLGIILIVAHNWDELPKAVKTCLAVLPLLLGQLICAYTLYKKPQNTAWRESSAAFLFCAVGAAISLIGQIYHIHGDLKSFLLTWMLLGLPLVYVMNSSIVSLLYICGITYYAVEEKSWFDSDRQDYLYWLLLPGIIPHYYRLYKLSPKSNFMIFHNWLVPLSLIIALATLAGKSGELLAVAYCSMLGCFYLTGNQPFFAKQHPAANGYKILGSLGTIFLLIIYSFNWFWDELLEEHHYINQFLASAEFAAAAVFTVLACILLYKHLLRQSLQHAAPLAFMFLFFLVIFLFGLVVDMAPVLVNLCALLAGILLIREGDKQNHLGILNYGLLTIALLVICRFFDTHLSFVLRGILFVCVGLGFFLANYRLIKKRNANG